MRLTRRFVNHVAVLLLCNIIFLWNLPSVPFIFKLLATLFSVVFFLWLNISPFKNRGLPRKIGALGAGCELLLTATVCAVLQIALWLFIWQTPFHSFDVHIWVFNSIIGLLAIYILLINAALRLFFSSSQLSLVRRVLLVCLWWVPVANFSLFFIAWPIAHKEYNFQKMAYERNQQRKALNVCQTRYPLLLVHGIFFRDWEGLNYWGRIPAGLAENGATIYYGQQQSSSSVQQSAEELKNRILQIVNETGCQKVNIIAHSKGGLDSRYAISCLGMDEYVASLTTINTPHHGCRFAKKALDNIPKGVVDVVSSSYDKLFAKLGDKHPDFFSGVSDLTDETCTALNQQMPDRPGVLYQSIGSQMKTAKSAPFPLNLGHSIINPIDGDNDGLVAIGSMPWGSFTMLHPTGKKGISHADMIDLTRKDIDNFDVCELYVGLVQGLKEKGL